MSAIATITGPITSGGQRCEYSVHWPAACASLRSRPLQHAACRLAPCRSMPYRHDHADCQSHRRCSVFMRNVGFKEGARGLSMHARIIPQGTAAWSARQDRADLRVAVGSLSRLSQPRSYSIRLCAIVGTKRECSIAELSCRASGDGLEGAFAVKRRWQPSHLAEAWLARLGELEVPSGLRGLGSGCWRVTLRRPDG